MSNIWISTKAKLRAWEPRDWEAQLSWRDDTSGERADSHVPFPVSVPATKADVEAMALRKPDGDNFEWIISDLDGNAVGCIGSHNCQRTNGTFEMGFFVSPEHRRKGYAREAILLLVRFMFNERRYQKANADAYSYNEASLKLLESLGLQIEGRSRRMQFSNGAHHDLVRFGITIEEFRIAHADWLKANASPLYPWSALLLATYYPAYDQPRIRFVS